MAQIRHPHDGLATAVSLSLRFPWVVVWFLIENRLPVATALVAIMSAAALCSRTHLSRTMAGPGPMHGADPTLGAVSVVATSASFSCCSRLHPTWCASFLLEFWFIWPVCAIDLTARPSRWPHLGAGLAACPAVWRLALGQLISVTPVVAKGTPVICCSSLQPLWHVSPPFVLWSACPHSATGLLGAALVAIMGAVAPCSRTHLPRTMTGLFVGPMHGADPMARTPRWPILAVGLVAWLGIAGRQLDVGPVVAMSASLSCRSRFHPTWCASLLPVFWLIWLASSVHSTDSAVRPPRWQIRVDSALEGPPVRPGSDGTTASVPEPVIPTAAAPMARSPPTPAEASVAANPRDSSVPSETPDPAEEVGDDASPEPDASDVAADRSNLTDAPYDPMVHTETSDMLEEALEISRDCVLLADLTGVIQANGEDLVNEAIPEAADSIIREVAASILGVSASPDAAIVPSRPASKPSASPSKSGLSKSAPARLHRATMPVVPEHHEFDEWCTAQSRTPPVAEHTQAAVARASSIPPVRSHKRQASSSDPSRTKRSRPSTSSTTRIPSVPKAGMSSVNNSPAETARQSRREK
ncbi:hypothetical protein V6N11_050933 [Hibiscus sabdariffa]|uniref:Uncharacterized protein n=1 Tax=Hibiscus sabdariffa TaxID=183260 RepID=A0ABR2R2T7_9ROSI